MLKAHTAVFRRFARSSIAPVQNGRRRSLRLAAKLGGIGDSDVDVAVFRFTLGIPGFDDKYVPRIVGAVGAALLVINHLISTQDLQDAQERTEYLAVFLAAVLIIAPDIEDRLREVLPGRGKRKAAGPVQGADSVFWLNPDAGDAVQKELAWASFSVLKNTNACGVVVFGEDGKALLARGALRAMPTTPTDPLPSQQQRLASLSQDAVAATAGAGVRWLADRAAMSSGGLSGKAWVPEGWQSALLVPFGGQGGGGGGDKGVLVVGCDAPRGLTKKDQSWAAALAEKLSLSLSSKE